MSSHIPFDQDINLHGQYRYTGENAPLSSQLANKGQSRLVHQFIRDSNSFILDIGCGDGEYTAEIAGIHPKSSVLGIDPSSPAIAVAVKKWSTIKNLKFEDTDLSSLVEQERFFDVAVIRGVLHHAENPDEILRLASLICTRVIVLEPNGLNFVLKVIEKTSRYHIEHGERSFSRWKITRWANLAGFTRVRMDVGVLVPFFCPSWIARILKVLEPSLTRIPAVRWLISGTQVFEFRRS